MIFSYSLYSLGVHDQCTILSGSTQLKADDCHLAIMPLFVYHEAIKRELNRKHMKCDERLKAKREGATRLPYTRLRGGLEHLRIETRLIDERFVSVMGECVI